MAPLQEGFEEVIGEIETSIDEGRGEDYPRIITWMRDRSVPGIRIQLSTTTDTRHDVPYKELLPIFQGLQYVMTDPGYPESRAVMARSCYFSVLEGVLSDSVWIAKGTILWTLPGGPVTQ